MAAGNRTPTRGDARFGDETIEPPAVAGGSRFHTPGPGPAGIDGRFFVGVREGYVVAFEVVAFEGL